MSCWRRRHRLPGALAIAGLLLGAACTSEAVTSARPDSGNRPRPARSGPPPPCPRLDRLVEHVARGYVPFLSPDLLVVPHAPNYIGRPTAPVHSGPWPYLTQVPLVLYGPGHIRPGSYPRPATMADLAPTTARIIGFDGWPRRDGRILEEALVNPASPPRLVVTIVWDGAGWNVLRAHPGKWPYLESLLEDGAFFPRMTIGSSPSSTAPVHTTLSTGAWPATTGVPGLRARTPDNSYVDPFDGFDPSGIRIPTLGDLYDLATGNRAVVGGLGALNWHLAMVGHGAGLQSGDADPAVLLQETDDLVTNAELFSMADIADSAHREEARAELDRSDGNLDGKWQDKDLSDGAVGHASPADVAYEEFLLERLIESEGFGEDSVPDLLYVNFKPSDTAGHRWGMTSPEVGEVLQAQDDALRRFVGHLDDTVGPGQWAIALTADHGQTPYPEDSGGWPISGAELKADLNARFDGVDNGIDLVDFVISPGAYVRPGELERNDVALPVMARWLAGYTVAENRVEAGSLPRWYEGEEADRLFDAVMVGDRLAATSCERTAGPRDGRK